MSLGPSCRRAISKLLIYTVAALLVLSGVGERPTAAAARQTKLAAGLEAFVDKQASNDQFSGAVLLARHGQPLVRRGYGLADRARGRLNTPETPFMLSSVSKMFTAAATAMLVQRKQLSFDTTIGTVVPDYPLSEARDRVTVRDLLTMSSGIQDLFRVPAFWSEIATIKSPTDFWRYFASTPLQFPPGSRWNYSNSNFLLLGMIIERRTGRTFTSVIEDEIFRPLKLANTHYAIDAARPAALGYTRAAASAVGAADAAGWYPAWKDPKPGDEFIVASPMGGGYSTVDDLARFASALIGNRLFSKELTNRVLTGYIDADYGGRDGYGFETRLVNGIRMAGHRGSLAGSANQVEFYPDLGYVLIVLGNTDTQGTQSIADYARELITSSARR
jgi:CubicO group peptidase (beta-lactamase class C family)